MLENQKNGLKRLLQRIGRGVAQDVPPGLEACEICRKTECLHDEWIACENRLVHAKCLEAHQETSDS